jgi:hypothetical protein
VIEGYVQLSPGHWHQKVITGPVPTYKSDYSKNSYDVYNTTDKMSELRYNLVEGCVGEFSSICDFGYGNGSFLKYCNEQGKITYGYDVSDYPVPKGTQRIENIDYYPVDVMTFFDSLEHLPQADLLSFLKNKPVKHICISVPWFHESLGGHWFRNWKHRRENEHFHHFDSNGLINLVIQAGYKVIHVGNHEDLIRKPVDNYPNILTVIASKIQ